MKMKLLQSFLKLQDLVIKLTHAIVAALCSERKGSWNRQKEKKNHVVNDYILFHAVSVSRV